MADQASYATQASESDFHDSHPLSDAISQHSLASTPSALSAHSTDATHSIGDLTSVDSDIKTKVQNTQVVGDISQIESDQKSELLSDISLLDEAFAELEEDAPESTAELSNEIPVLNEAITAPSESRIITDENSTSSIPLLDQEATIFAEISKQKTDSPTTQTLSFAATAVSSLDELQSELEEPHSEAPIFVADNSNINELDSSLDVAAQLTNKTSTSQFDNVVSSVIENKPSEIEDASNMTSFDQSVPVVTEIEQSSMTTNDDNALEALLTDDLDPPEYNDPNIASSISNLSLDIESILEVNTTSIDEKIANAANQSDSVIINEFSPTSDFSQSEFSIDSNEGLTDDNLADENLINSFPQENTSDDQSEISAFNPAIDLDSQTVTHTSHSIGITGEDESKTGNQLNLSIPFELHSQLSKKIDALVIDATASITDELQCQLTSRLDSLLGNAVESVLPKLVNQMAGELRNDVNRSIKQQLPSIINEVLNKTRLHS